MVLLKNTRFELAEFLAVLSPHFILDQHTHFSTMFSVTFCDIEPFHLKCFRLTIERLINKQTNKQINKCLYFRIYVELQTFSVLFYNTKYCGTQSLL